MTPPIISVENLVTYYGRHQVLKGVSLAVEQGEILVIMGGSGSGKSTLLRHLLGLHAVTSGKIEIFGKNIQTLDWREEQEFRRNIGVSFQGGALFTSMTVGENVRLPLQEHSRLDEQTIAIMSRMKLEMVDLSESEDLMPSELSGGMIKRAALARAIVMDPKLLFFDEPSAGLDPVVAAELDQMILELRDAMRMTMVVVTHDLDSAFQIADKIAVLDQGEILQIGSVEMIKQSKHPRVQALLQRQIRTTQFDPDEYLERLMSGSGRK